MYAFLPIPAIIPTSEIPNLSPEAAEFRDRVIASMDIALNGMRILAGDMNKPENQTNTALTQGERLTLEESVYSLFATVANSLVDETIPVSLLQQSAAESRVFPQDTEH